MILKFIHAAVFIDGSLLCMVAVRLEVNFCLFFAHGCLIFPALLVEISVLSPLGFLLNASWPSMFGSPPGLCSVPFTCMSVLTPALHCIIVAF